MPNEPTIGTPSGRTSILAPVLGPSTTVASAAGDSSARSELSASWAGPHSRGSTKRCMVPPQVSPTAKASSSLNPKVTMRRSPVAITSKDSVTTAPSTQPPDTEPTTSASAVTAIAAPGERGPEPSMSTTRATAARSPVRRQRFRSARISFTAALRQAPDSWPVPRPARAGPAPSR